MSSTYLPFVACLIVVCSAVADAAKPLDFGYRKQLLVDDYVIESHANLRRILHPAKKENNGKPIFTGGQFY